VNTCDIRVMKEATILLCGLFLRLFVVQADEHDHHVSEPKYTTLRQCMLCSYWQ